MSQRTTGGGDERADGDDARLPPPGFVLADKYRLGETLGAGAMGRVVSAVHLLLDQPVAIKLLIAGTENAQRAERFLREARALLSFHSEHVVRVFDFGVLDGRTPYIVMERLEGADLANILRARGPLPISETVDYVLQACVGIAEAHALGIVHRDLKPSNLFVARRPNGAPLVKVLDFGISKGMRADKGEEDIHLTASLMLLGSPAYMSPEQVRNAKNVDHRADIWSLGVILYTALRGELPFDGDGPTAFCAAVVADPPKPLRDARGDVPPALEGVIMDCLEKDRQKRPQSVAQLARALAPFATSTGRTDADRIVELFGRGASSPPPAPPVTPLPSEPRGPLTTTASEVGASSVTLREPEATPATADVPRKGSRRWLGIATAASLLVGTTGWAVFARPGAHPAATHDAAVTTGATSPTQAQSAPARELPAVDPLSTAPAPRPNETAPSSPEPARKGPDTSAPSAVGSDAGHAPLRTKTTAPATRPRVPSPGVAKHESGPRELDDNGVPIVE